MTIVREKAMQHSHLNGVNAASRLSNDATPLQPATRPEHHRFHLLDALRGIAAISVMMLHAPPQYSAPFLFQNSFLAVDFFFCLSGFVIAFSYEDRLMKSMSLRRFTIARAIRLYPLAILGTLLGAAFMLAGFGNHGRVLTPGGVVSHLALGLLMIPSNRYDVLFPLNPVMWTLFFELIANIAYAATVRAHIAKSSVLLLIALCSLVYLIATCRRSGTFDLGYSAQQFFIGLSRVGLSFFAGTLTFRAYHFTNKQKLRRASALIAASAIVSFFCLILCDALSITKLPIVQLAVTSIVFPSIIYAGAHCAIALTSLCGFLGTISYPLYALHDVLFEPMFRTRSLQFAAQHNTSAPALMLAATALLLAVSWLSAKHWDTPHTLRTHYKVQYKFHQQKWCLKVKKMSTSPSDNNNASSTRMDSTMPTNKKNQHPTLTGAEILWASLAGEGTTTVFGYPGGAILPIYDALRKFPTIHHVLVRHEQGASHMADGYARASGKVGVCMATSGPGATNLVTGLATAMLDSIPIIAITGQVSSKVLGSDAFQEVDITGITLPVTKHNFVVTRAEDIAATVREAFQIARSGRPGPVLVDITKDAQQASAIFDFDGALPKPARPHPMLRAENAAMREAAELIKTAKKPVILAGHGIVESGAEADVIAFAESRHIPIASTLLGLGAIPAGHPLSLGMMGMHGESWVNNAIQDSDLLLAFGMRFDDRVTGNLASYAQNAKKIHVEIDPSEINKNVRVDVALIGDLKAVLQTLAPMVPKASDSSWLKQINASKGTAAVRDIINLPDNGHLYAAHVIHDIWREAQAAGRLEKTIIVTDVGQHQMWEAQYFKHESPRSLVTSGGLGTMGFALPAAIGAKFACPEKDVWVIAGDGGFQMTAAELSTIVQEKIAVNIAVINNGFLGMVRQWQETFYEKNYSASPILSPDFVMLAGAHGIEAANVTKRSDVTPTVTKARTGGKPFLINFAVEKEDGVYPMIAPGAALHEMVRRPQHDPLLETAEDE